jgi:hypothetical protein
MGPDAKEIANEIRRKASQIRPAIQSAFEKAIVGVGNEVQFIKKLSVELQSAFQQLADQSYPFSCRISQIHQKPIVRIINTGSRCELGDILVVVKYHLPGGVREKHSILHQVKMAAKDSTQCAIDQTQLQLLSNWPKFEFGRKAAGGPIQYSVQPVGLEFGSYMLEPRNVNLGDYAVKWSNSYGVVPTAHLVRSEGPNTVDLKKLPYTRADAQGIFSLLAFEVGEHDSNEATKGTFVQSVPGKEEIRSRRVLAYLFRVAEFGGKGER